MINKFNVIAFITSIVIALILNFNQSSLAYVIIFSSFCAIIFFLTAKLLQKILTHKKIKKVHLIFYVLLIFSYGLFYYLYPVHIPSGGCNITYYYRGHPATNSITNKCEIVKEGCFVDEDPWYYKKGCNISKEELEQLYNKARLQNLPE
jgi:predicted PurR-regulated permease PerM